MQPCGNCVRRQTNCEFDTVSGSMHTESLKDRIRSLEYGDQITQERNRYLEEEVRRLTSVIANLTQAGSGSHPHPARGEMEVWGEQTSDGHNSVADVAAADSASQYSVGSSTAHSMRPSDGQPFRHYADNMQPRAQSNDMRQSLHSYSRSDGDGRGDGGYTSAQLEVFLNQHRFALKEGQDPDLILNSGLDVGPLIDATRPMTQWSAWALQLPLNSPDMSLCAKLACAFVTYHQLRWLIYPTQENYDMIPDFIKPTVAQLCVPHMVWIHLMIRSSLNEAVVTVTDVVEGQNAQSMPNLLSIRLMEWDRPMSEATRFHERSGHTRLTSAFETYIKDSSHWHPHGPDKLDGHNASSGDGLYQESMAFT